MVYSCFPASSLGQPIEVKRKSLWARQRIKKFVFEQNSNVFLACLAQEGRIKSENEIDENVRRATRSWALVAGKKGWRRQQQAAESNHMWNGLFANVYSVLQQSR